YSGGRVSTPLVCYTRRGRVLGGELEKWEGVWGQTFLSGRPGKNARPHQPCSSWTRTDSNLDRLAGSAPIVLVVPVCDVDGQQVVPWRQLGHKEVVIVRVIMEQRPAADRATAVLEPMAPDLLTLCIADLDGAIEPGFKSVAAIFVGKVLEFYIELHRLAR